MISVPMWGLPVWPAETMIVAESGSRCALYVMGKPMQASWVMLVSIPNVKYNGEAMIESPWESATMMRILSPGTALAMLQAENMSGRWV